MRIFMVGCLSLFAMFAGCAVDTSEDPVSDTETAEAEGIADPEATPSEEELAADSEIAEAERIADPEATAEEDLVVDAEADGADVEADPEAAAAAEASDPTELAPCGLNIYAAGGGSFWYTIRNCHSYRVKREVRIAGYLDHCTCHDLAPGETVDHACALPAGSPDGLKSC